MIPYTTDARADTGVTNVTMGIWLFLASEVMLFGALFSAYALLRTAAVDWPYGPDVLNLAFGVINTAMLIMASVLAWRVRSRAATTRDVRRLFLMSSAFALAFLVFKGFEYQGEIALGIVPSVGTFFAMYYVLTGVHALHVVAGLVANVWTAAGAGRVDDRMTAGRVHAVTLYWAFVDLVWLVILVLMYLT